MVLLPPERLFRRDERFNERSFCLLVQFERTSRARQQGLGAIQAAGHAVHRGECPDHVAHDAGDEAEFHRAQHAVVERGDSGRREELPEQRSFRRGVEQHHDASILGPVVAQQLGAGRGQIVARADDDNPRCVFWHPTRDPEVERGDAHALPRDPS